MDDTPTNTSKQDLQVTSTMTHHDDPSPAPKRIKTLHDDDTTVTTVTETATTETTITTDDTTESTTKGDEFTTCSNLLFQKNNEVLPKGFHTESFTPTGDNLQKVRNLFNHYGFRTSVITSPRAALSIYKDSCTVNKETFTMMDIQKGKEFLITMLGMHPHQTTMEQCYTSNFQHIYCFLVFCQRIRQICPKASQDTTVNTHMVEYEQICQSLAMKVQQQQQQLPPQDVSSTDEDCNSNSSNSSIEKFMTTFSEHNQLTKTNISERLQQLISLVVQIDRGVRVEQLEREYERLTIWNSTLANVYVQLFMQSQNCCIKDVYFKKSHLPKYERITVYLYDSELDYSKPPQFTFTPCVRELIDHGVHEVVQIMMVTFWDNLLRHGYFATCKLKQQLSPELEKYFVSGIIQQDPNIPVLLNAHFTPTYPLSFYLYGKAGSGKSSLVRNFTPALHETIERCMDPELLVRFVKQNLNKPQCDLELELELRPNNNDLSVMSIIQGRRMSMTQSKPGLVVIDLEEMPSNLVDANPNQLKTSQLISQRFSGRKSQYKSSESSRGRTGTGTAPPRNSTKRGISGDATLIPLFTSNYVLDAPCKEALERLEMFSNLQCIHMTAVDGKDRILFAHCYLKQCIQDRFPTISTFTTKLNISLGTGDTRPLVRHLRMIAFYICALMTKNTTNNSTTTALHANVVQNDNESQLCTVNVGDQSIDLKVGTMENLFPIVPQVFDERVGKAMKEITAAAAAADSCWKGSVSSSTLSELSQIIDFYFARTLTPAVVVSSNATFIKALVQAIGNQHNVHSIQNVQAGTYKMMKSLYDPNDTPNLRDDILQFGKGAYVAVELKCPTIDGQLCIREIIEDSPSMTAFSTTKSALYKSGLFFAVHVVGELTPEVKSRASIVV